MYRLKNLHLNNFPRRQLKEWYFHIGDCSCQQMIKATASNIPPIKMNIYMKRIQIKLKTSLINEEILHLNKYIVYKQI